MHAITSTYTHTPLGLIKISEREGKICEVLFEDEDHVMPQSQTANLPPVLVRCQEQLKEYFNGDRKNFELDIAQTGTAFQQSVWKELQNIPYGKTISYLQLSKNLGNIKAIRAAASTNGKNKIAIVVPCHRVIGSNNSLVGYAGGLSKKKWLLMHEAKFTHQLQTLF